MLHTCKIGSHRDDHVSKGRHVRVDDVACEVQRVNERLNQGPVARVTGRRMSDVLVEHDVHVALPVGGGLGSEG